mmetsp:Transcript_23509/g.54624  ORF Transcript_23509/g.54624 Transcript_23509/m.54624 type:complete len:98 (+) Transcript_23509:763-1056(+)
MQESLADGIFFFTSDCAPGMFAQSSGFIHSTKYQEKNGVNDQESVTQPTDPKSTTLGKQQHNSMYHDNVGGNTPSGHDKGACHLLTSSWPSSPATRF